ncbi:transposase, partial [bacterium]|nr:transposase [bacterium]
EDGFCYAVQVSRGNRSTFQLFLDLLQPNIIEKRPNYLILDNARFHHAKGLDWGKLIPLFLPPYSPELNPIETLWLQMKKKHFNGWWTEKIEELEKRVDDVIDHFKQHPEWIQRTCATTTYF